MDAITPVSEEELKKKAHYDQFFCQDSVTITVQSVYQHCYSPENRDHMTLLCQLKEIAKARGYNVTESRSNFTGAKYIHFKKYRIENPAPVQPALPDTPQASDVVLDV